jgi:hypothetical protein
MSAAPRFDDEVRFSKKIKGLAAPRVGPFIFSFSFGEAWAPTNPVWMAEKETRLPFTGVPATERASAPLHRYRKAQLPLVALP